MEALLSASKMFWRFTPGLPNPWKPVQEDAKAGERAVFPNGGLKEALDEGNFHKAWGEGKEPKTLFQEVFGIIYY